jgi:hypothetical protein
VSQVRTHPFLLTCPHLHTYLARHRRTYGRRAPPKPARVRRLIHPRAALSSPKPALRPSGSCRPVRLPFSSHLLHYSCGAARSTHDAARAQVRGCGAPHVPRIRPIPTRSLSRPRSRLYAPFARAQPRCPPTPGDIVPFAFSDAVSCPAAPLALQRRPRSRSTAPLARAQRRCSLAAMLKRQLARSPLHFPILPRPRTSSGHLARPASRSTASPSCAQRHLPTSPPALVQRRRPLAPNGVVRLRPTASSARAQRRCPLAPNGVARSRPVAPLAPNGVACLCPTALPLAPSRPAVPPPRAKRRRPLVSKGVACSRPTTSPACVQRRRLLASHGVACSRPKASPARAQWRHATSPPACVQQRFAPSAMLAYHGLLLVQHFAPCAPCAVMYCSQ